ncbi:MAG: lipoyl(octanoyl) transferase [Dehalococcoidales bacterium]|jgi:lipoate-protein ligase B|nr:lipoyl(octanoyl) transferase [Dehalococcoidales bacterium]
MSIATKKKANCPDSKKSRLPYRKVCIIGHLGIMPYELALKLQQRLTQARAEGDVPDVLLLLEHPPVVTIGRFRGEEDLIVPPEILTGEEIAVFLTNRGGGITYHGPGQLVGYPILNIKENGLSVREYIWKLESVIIKLLLGLGIQGQRVLKHPGVWVHEKKVCSIGIHVNRYITMHGFALNVSNDLRYFEYIRPCGLRSEMMTSLSQLLERPIEVKTIIDSLINSFSETFGLECEPGNDQWLSQPTVPRGKLE